MLNKHTLRAVVTLHNKRPSLSTIQWFDELESFGIRLSDLGERFPLYAKGWFWQTPFGDVLVLDNGKARINDPA